MIEDDLRTRFSLIFAPYYLFFMSKNIFFLRYKWSDIPNKKNGTSFLTVFEFPNYEKTVKLISINLKLSNIMNHRDLKVNNVITEVSIDFSPGGLLILIITNRFRFCPQMKHR